MKNSKNGKTVVRKPGFISLDNWYEIAVFRAYVDSEFVANLLFKLFDTDHPFQQSEIRKLLYRADKRYAWWWNQQLTFAVKAKTVNWHMERKTDLRAVCDGEMTSTRVSTYKEARNRSSCRWKRTCCSWKSSRLSNYYKGQQPNLRPERKAISSFSCGR